MRRRKKHDTIYACNENYWCRDKKLLLLCRKRLIICCRFLKSSLKKIATHLFELNSEKLSRKRESIAFVCANFHESARFKYFLQTLFKHNLIFVFFYFFHFCSIQTLWARNASCSNTKYRIFQSKYACALFLCLKLKMKH